MIKEDLGSGSAPPGRTELQMQEAERTPGSGVLVLFRRACRVTCWTLVALVTATLALPLVFHLGAIRQTATLAFTQDFYIALILPGLLLFAADWAVFGRPTNLSRRTVAWWVAGLTAFILLVGWAGHYLVFNGYDLSRDEQMASFDTAIFRSGRLIAPIPADWRPLANALNLSFILPVGAREYWVSAYLPVNAAWRAAVSLVADPALASPLMAALGAFCLWRVSRLLWPASAATQLVCVLLYAGSSQVLVTAMTAYSMSMHLALNMLWLWLFLLDRRWSHTGAIIVGWLATGIHQPLFHPLFVVPFLVLLAGQKRWKLLAAYAFAYSLIAAFWLAWPLWISAHGSAPAMAVPGTSGVGFIERLMHVLRHSTVDPPWVFAANMLRFICWQHPLLIPLAIVGTWTTFRREALPRALCIGFVLPIVVVTLLLPWQGYGWGYRYVHQVLGNAVLLGGFGWHALESRGLNLRPAMLRTTAIAILLLFPLEAAMAHRIVTPFARLHDELISIDADAVVIDTDAAPSAEDLVFNLPDFANRPKFLMASDLTPRDIEALCRLGSVAFVPGPKLAPVAKLFGGDPATEPTPQFAALVASANRIGCGIGRFPVRT